MPARDESDIKEPTYLKEDILRGPELNGEPRDFNY